MAAAGSMPADPDSDSDKEHPVQEPQFVFLAVDDERRQGPGLLPVHQRPLFPAGDPVFEERLRILMIMPQTLLCGSTFILGFWIIYFASSPDKRAQPNFNIDWDVFVTVWSALVMLFSLVSVLLSFHGVYGWHRQGII